MFFHRLGSGYNRTYVELKLICWKMASMAFIRYNRTYVELKL